MKVWKLYSELEGYAAICSLKHDITFKISDNFDGRSLKEGWEPLLYTKHIDEKKLPLGDKPNSLPSMPIVSHRALECIKELIIPYVEVLPVYIDGFEFFLINILDIIDCLDYEKSELSYFRSDPHDIKKILKYEFLKDKIWDKVIFKIPENKLNVPFVTDQFKLEVEKHGLEGFRFEKVWDSEQ
jgi:hypothetical protein